jgi:tetratricopeptide (TPR) repeat protein
VGYLSPSLIPRFLLILVFFQSPQDKLQKHFQAADAQRRAGDLAAAEKEYKAVLADGYGKLGKIYAAQKKYQPAIDALESARLYGPDSEEVLIDLAIAYFNGEQYQKALESSDQALSAGHKSASAHQMLGKSYFMLGNFDKAATELQAALKINAGDNEVAYTLGLAFLKQHQLAPAQQIYQRMREQLGDHPELHIVFGRAYRETGFLSEAIDEFKKAVALDANFPRAHYYLGLTYLLKDGASRLPDAEQEFKFELNSHADEFFANYYLGIVYLMDRKWEPAIGFLQKAALIQPANPDPYFHLGQAYQATERYAEAIEVLRKSISLNPFLSHNDYQVATAHYRLGQSLLKAGQNEAGQKELQVAADLKSKSLQRDKEKNEIYVSAANLHDQNSKFPEMISTEGVIAESKSPDPNVAAELKAGEVYFSEVIAKAHNELGLLRADRGDFKTATEQFALASKRNSQLEGLNFNWGLAAFKAELYKDATTPLEEELRAHPDNLQAKQLLGLSYFMLENYPKTSQLLSEVIVARPFNAGVYYTLALSLIKEEKREEADQVIKQMVVAGGDSPQLHIVLGQAYNEQGETAKALEELQRAVSLDSKVPMVHYYLGLVYLKAGSFEEATTEFDSELALSPGNVQAKYHLGFVLLAQQKAAAGIKIMREVIQTKPDFADAYYELGKALVQQGEIKDGVVSLEMAAKLAPDKSYVQYQLGRAYLAAGRKAEGENHLEISRQLKEKERQQTKP